MPPKKKRTKGKGARTSNDLGSLLLRCRAQKRLKLSDVAKAVGLGIATICRIEHGLNKGNPDPTTRVLIEDFLRAQGYLPKSRKAA